MTCKQTNNAPTKTTYKYDYVKTTTRDIAYIMKESKKTDATIIIRIVHKKIKMDNNISGTKALSTPISSK